MLFKGICSLKTCSRTSTGNRERSPELSVWKLKTPANGNYLNDNRQRSGIMCPSGFVPFQIGRKAMKSGNR